MACLTRYILPNIFRWALIRIVWPRAEHTTTTRLRACWKTEATRNWITVSHISERKETQKGIGRCKLSSAETLNFTHYDPKQLCNYLFSNKQIRVRED